MEHTLTQREVLDIATSIGYYILKNGGEINRAEDTAERLGLAYGMDAVHVFAISASIVVSVEKDGESLSQTRRVKRATTNLDKVEKFNALSRRICETRPTYAEICESCREIKRAPSYPEWIAIFAYSIISGAFAVFFGGGINECVSALFIGIVLRFVMLLAEKLQSPPFFANASGSAIIVLLTRLIYLAFPVINTEIITIGVLMNLVPGVLITNCIRDFVATDYTAGMSKVGEACFIAAGIALGVSVSVLWR